MDFGQRLKLLRTNKKISQKSLGTVLGMSQENISFYENSKREPDINTLKKIAEFFTVSLDYLMVLETSNINSDDNSPSNFPKIDLNGLNESEINDIKKYVSFIKSKK